MGQVIMWAWYALVMLTLVNGWCCLICCCYGCLEEERIGLLEIKAWINRPDGDSPELIDWVDNKEGADCCEWPHVGCDETTRRVISLDLSDTRDRESSGDFYLNASLFLPFKELKSLRLFGNQLVGCYENQGFQLLTPPLRKLEVLDLRVNMLNDSILSCLGGLASLESLDLSANMLTGLTGVDASSSTKLEELDLSYNSLNDSILYSLSRLSTLKSLDLSGNELLTGSMEIKGLRNLEVLHLEDLNMTGSVLLLSFEALPSLKTLWLDGSNLKAMVIGQEVFNLTKLEELYLDYSRLPPTFLRSIGAFSTLKVLSLRSCDPDAGLSFEGWCEPKNLEDLGLFPKFQLRWFTVSNAYSTEIPKFLYTQYELTDLDLSNNNFSGIFPFWIIGNNTRLEEVAVEGNSFTGPLQWPSHAFPNLQVIAISNNKIHGQIPRNTCSLFPNLLYFVMSNNELTDSIPDCVGNMTSLIVLDLSNNHLSSMGSVAQLNSLQILKLSNNNLDGQISPSFFNSSALSHLCLDGNNFQGQIWDFSIKPHSDFAMLNISNNYLTGMLPKWLGNMSSLEVTDLSNNRFVGLIPTEFCKIHRLEFLHLSENHLSGTIPSCLKSRHLHLQKNQLSGQLTHAFANCSSLVTLDLRENSLTGPIPNLSNLSALSVALLRANNLEGVLSSQICSLKNLSILDLSRNKLSGPLPSCLGNLTFKSVGGFGFGQFFEMTLSYYIYELHIAGEVVEFTTKRRSYLYTGEILDFMSGIDLSCNKFTGEIPPELGNLSEIHALNLSYNNLTGSIPVTFSNLKQIESLDLSCNNLIGGIPPQLDLLHFLSTFNVSYNNLSGRTPERKNQFGTFDESSYWGNPNLCGPPLQNICGETESPPQPDVPTIETEGDEGFIDMDAFYVTFGVCYVIVVLTIATILYINPYWRRRWFYFIEDCIDNCYYFILDGFHKLSNFKRRH